MGAGRSGYSEDALVEQPAVALFDELGWETADCFHEFEQAGGSPLGRETAAEVVLVRRLRAALEKLNPTLPAEAIIQAIEEITRDRSRMSLAAANQEVYRLLKEGVRAKALNGALTPALSRGERGKTKRAETSEETVRVIDWNDPASNDFFLASQFWVTGEMYTRRADLVGFVNGLPLVFVELKAAHKSIESAFQQNLRDYKTTTPHLFWYNGIIILSNGSQSRIGSVTAEWEHFAEWKRINSEGEQGIVSLETMIRGTCDPARLMDLVENFTLFQKTKKGLLKLLAKNHQYLGVNSVIAGLQHIRENQGRLGVFWHTQGSGKSISMIFFAQKALRKLSGTYTFVVVTDRKDLDKQIYDNFVDTGAITEAQARAESGKDLQRRLVEDHRYVFTLIQKFGTEKGERYPVVSTRSDIIVITDEAHRTQYDTLALNMRNALPNAAFIAFTGTPLIVAEEKTRQVFGDYVSIYNFQQSVEDKATVPLFYENRIPELQLTNESLNEDMEDLLEAAELDEEQEKKLEREFAREYQLITREDRLERIAQDIVAHFMGREQQGKAMVVCIDKATAVKMYDKVQKHWKAYLKDLRDRPKAAKDADERGDLAAKVKFMQETDMAVVVSQSQNEFEDLKKKGADITPHRRRMIAEDLDEKFKDPDDRFRVVFVCAMWMTGFDVPCCSTIYLDKPMRNHTLMQTIARANRVFRDKVNGLIVDYVGVFRNLQKALAIYAPAAGDGATPVRDKAELVTLLRQAIEEATDFCRGLGIRLERVLQAKGLQKVKLLDDAVEPIPVNDDTKRRFRLLTERVARLLRAIKPDPAVNDFLPVCTLLVVIAEKIRSLGGPVDISEVMADVEELLDRSIATQGYAIQGQKPVDLSRIDFKALRKRFEEGRRRTEIEKLRGSIAVKLQEMVRLNRTRMDYLEKFQQMIDEYNAGSVNADEFFRQLVEFAQTLNVEERRGIAEGLSEEELAVYDLLLKAEVKLTAKEEQQVKKVAKDILERLKDERLVLDWRKKQQARAAVRQCIEQMLDRLPPAYTPKVYEQTCERAYLHVYDSYFGEGKSIYSIPTPRPSYVT
ncbi:MAG: type I restriction endonuclease subunit R [candidate division NC10 bacterium]|nr:type I restriction endonuclease subunit R [candidate division NC10 bacterium]